MKPCIVAFLFGPRRSFRLLRPQSSISMTRGSTPAQLLPEQLWDSPQTNVDVLITLKGRVKLDARFQSCPQGAAVQLCFSQNRGFFVGLRCSSLSRLTKKNANHPFEKLKQAKTCSLRVPFHWPGRRKTVQAPDVRRSPQFRERGPDAHLGFMARCDLRPNGSEPFLQAVPFNTCLRGVHREKLDPLMHRNPLTRSRCTSFWFTPATYPFLHVRQVDHLHDLITLEAVKSPISDNHQGALHFPLNITPPKTKLPSFCFNSRKKMGVASFGACVFRKTNQKPAV